MRTVRLGARRSRRTILGGCPTPRVPPAPLPLAGRRVLDRTTDWAELASRLLADLGATVVKAEPAGGSPSRHHAPVRSGVSLSWEVRNAGKSSIELDERTAEGRDLLDRLAGWAEIVITERAEDAALFDAHPGLIVAVVTPFGLTGPQAGHVATDAVIAACGGQAFKAGLPTREPVPPPSRFSATTCPRRRSPSPRSPPSANGTGAATAT